jgi:bifunctional DNA-binding transcriptional regulator/antitoxin component of YhaV-PrlF toxin-antitoxin module
MANNETVLGTSKVDPRYRITLVKPIPELLGVNVGDLIVFVQDSEGNVLLKVSNISSTRRLKRREGENARGEEACFRG